MNDSDNGPIVRTPSSSSPSFHSPRKTKLCRQREPVGQVSDKTESSVRQRQSSQSHQNSRFIRLQSYPGRSGERHCRKRKIPLVKPKQLECVPPCVYKVQCHEARIQHAQEMERKALEASIHRNYKNQLRLQVKSERKEEKQASLRELHAKNISLRTVQWILVEGVRSVARRIADAARERNRLNKKKCESASKISRAWKQHRRARMQAVFWASMLKAREKVIQLRKDEEEAFQRRVQKRQIKEACILADIQRNISQNHEMNSVKCPKQYRLECATRKGEVVDIFSYVYPLDLGPSDSYSETIRLFKQDMNRRRLECLGNRLEAEENVDRTEATTPYSMND
mmetsp:Transcript_9685/g.14585  ORF Transcript_9685/g.14585 Transcript_9685/m.14585 type:complete len:340 (+) Transcript_9685:154-1173(+)|eukprot:CAMPEP_0185029650 /NCGR_PEP_ID=MMETSP1103-20130426/16068_1 /TAXON_ID=36769 /ORGANISM="Paraphysomonas bandaiensis, Strain Caron Lab Isolate" /LENGTH=339 /DNA_ID=CAMNT_0027564467 /DNA_START=58 /DNA_END=1077 /DNA_ORIENTATION=-